MTTHTDTIDPESSWIKAERAELLARKPWKAYMVVTTEVSDYGTHEYHGPKYRNREHAEADFARRERNPRPNHTNEIREVLVRFGWDGPQFREIICGQA